MYYIINIFISCPITACLYALNFKNHPRHHLYPRDFEYLLPIIRCSSVPVYSITYYITLYIPIMYIMLDVHTYICTFTNIQISVIYL